MIAILAAVMLQAQPVTLDEDQWTAVAPPPAESGPGAAMADCAGRIYAMRGDGTKDFWAYAPDQDAWAVCASVPVAVTAGGALASDGTSFVYGLAGSHLWRYGVQTDQWQDLGATPASIGWGGALAWANESLYVLRGNVTTDVWRFDPLLGSFEVLQPAPATVSYGGAMAVVGSVIVVLRGNNSDDVWNLHLDPEWWEIRPSLPQVVSAGGCATRLGSTGVLLFRGALSRNAFYDPSLGGTYSPIATAVIASGGTTLATHNGDAFAMFAQLKVMMRLKSGETTPAPATPPAVSGGGPRHRRCSGSAGGAPDGSLGVMALLALLASGRILRR